jgi:arylsulfatase A-like enzyme
MRLTVSIILFLVVVCVGETQAQNGAKRPPNIIFILADDLGYGDIGCYGQKKFSTPNIDKLAADGMRFTQAYAGTAVCSPSRASLFTGQHTGHTPIRDNKAAGPEGQFPLPDSTVTLPQLLKQGGYTTGCFGKWGLGYPGSTGDPVNKGIDEFYGYNSQTLAHNYYPHHLWHNKERIILPENNGANSVTYAPDLIHEKTLEFIDRNKDRPFALFVTTVIPHAEMVAPPEYMDRYIGKFGGETPYVGPDTSMADFKKTGAYNSQTHPLSAFAAMMSVLDDQVGDIVEKIKQLGLDGNTVIIFTSDNGPSNEGGKDCSFFESAGELRGLKRDLYEGGIRVPFIVKWPGKVKKGAVTHQITAFWDMLPTLTAIAGVRNQLKVDGISILPTLTAKGKQKQHPFLYWEFYEHGGKMAGRIDNWKGVRLNVLDNPNGPIELYDLNTDIGEKNNLAAQYPHLIKQFDVLFKKEHVPSPDFQFRPKKEEGK